MDLTALGYPEPLLSVSLSLSLSLCVCLLEQQQLLSRTSPVSSPLRFLRVAAAEASPFTERVQKKKEKRKGKTAQPTTKRVFFLPLLSSALLCSPLSPLLQSATEAGEKESVVWMRKKKKKRSRRRSLVHSLAHKKEEEDANNNNKKRKEKSQILQLRTVFSLVSVRRGPAGCLKLQL